MIKNTEIRVGNLVSNDRSLCKVNHIYGSDFINCSLKTKQGNFINANYDLIEPIPLTEEWLSKAGFEKTSHTYCLVCYCKDDFDFDIVKHGNKWVLSRNTDEECNSYFYFAHNLFENVHQFQNLYFSLTGSELVFSNNA